MNKGLADNIVNEFISW